MVAAVPVRIPVIGVLLNRESIWLKATGSWLRFPWQAVQRYRLVLSFRLAVDQVPAEYFVPGLAISRLAIALLLGSRPGTGLPEGHFVR
jgi:hypothetical protein